MCELRIGILREVLARRASFHWAFIEIPSQMLCFEAGGLIQHTEHKILWLHLRYLVLVMNIRCLGVECVASREQEAELCVWA